MIMIAHRPMHNAHRTMSLLTSEAIFFLTSVMISANLISIDDFLVSDLRLDLGEEAGFISSPPRKLRSRFSHHQSSMAGPSPNQDRQMDCQDVSSCFL